MVGCGFILLIIDGRFFSSHFFDGGLVMQAAILWFCLQMAADIEHGA
jgi:hypothetical protein